jgi:hypothetical protein
MRPARLQDTMCVTPRVVAAFIILILVQLDERVMLV